MLKIGTLYVLSEAEVEEICVEIDRLRTYKLLAEIRENTGYEEDHSENL